MVNLAGSRCFAKFRKNILTLTKARTSAQSVVKSVVIHIFNFNRLNRTRCPFDSRNVYKAKQHPVSSIRKAQCDRPGLEAPTATTIVSENRRTHLLS